MKFKTGFGARLRARFASRGRRTTVASFLVQAPVEPLEGRVYLDAQLYSNDFQGSAGPEWSKPIIATAPNGQKFLGQFGGGNNGFLRSGASWATGRAGRGSAVKLVSAGGRYVSVELDETMKFGGSVTASIWVKFPSAPTSQTLLDTISLTGGDGFRLAVNAAGKVYFDVRNGASLNNSAASGGTVLAANTWYHLTGTYDAATGQVSTYVNNALDRQVTRTAANMAATTATDMMVGRRHQAGQPEYVDGIIDDVQVFNRALTATEVTQLPSGVANGLVTFLKFDENTGTRVQDSADASGVVLNMSSLPAHDQLSVSFDLNVIQSWDGSAASTVAPDLWTLTEDGNTLLSTTFANGNTGGQAYPGTYPSDSHPNQTGASAVNSLGYTYNGSPWDSTYHLTFTFAHTGSSVSLRFNAADLQGIDDESWGIDNVSVAATTPAVVAATNLTAAAISGTQVRLEWKDDADGESGFSIERSADGTAWSVVGTAGPNENSYLDHGLSPSTEYFYRVRAAYGAGAGTTFSAYSNVAVAATMGAEHLYCNDFESPALVGGEWSRSGSGTSVQTSVTPVGGRRFLGEFNNDTVALSLDQLPAHEAITVDFDVYLIRSWDGSDNTLLGPDRWSLAVGGGEKLVDTTFSNHEESGTVGAHNNVQAWPGNFSDAQDNPATTGASEVDTLGYTYFRHSINYLEQMNSVVHVSRTFAHSSDSLVLDFAAMGLQGVSDETWGIDNLCVMKALVAPALTATPDDEQRAIDLDWDYAGSGAQAFVIERSTSGGEFQPIGQVDAPASTYVDGNVVLGQQYTYRVKAISGASESAYSNEVDAQLGAAFEPVIIINTPVSPAPTPPPGTPPAVGSVAEGTRIDLSGNLPSTPAEGVPELFWDVTKDGQHYAEGRGTAFSFTPDDNGDFNVTLSTSAIDGVPRSSSARFVVTNVAPAASIQGPDRVNSGETLSLQASITDPGTADTFTYHWSIRSAGGQEVFTSDTTSVDFDAPSDGFYRVELSVTDDDGGVAPMAAKTVLVANDVLDVRIDGAVDQMDEGASVTLTGATTNALSNYLQNYHWTVWKDGASEPYEEADGQTYWFNPTDNGTYTVELTAEDQIARGVAPPKTIVVNNVAPTVAVSATQTSLPEGTSKEVRVTGSIFDPSVVDTPVITSNWAVMKDGLPLELDETQDQPFVEFPFESGSVYTVRLTAADKDGGVGSDEVTLNTAPSAPTGQIVETNSTDTVTVRWADNSDIEDSYRVIYRRTGTTQETLSDAVGADVTAKVISGLVPGTLYDFKVEAFAAGGASLGATDWIAGATQPTAPAIVSTLATSNHSVQLTWTRDPTGDANANPSIGQFEIERRSERDVAFTRIVGVPANATSFVDKGLEAGHTYFYRVRSYTRPGGQADPVYTTYSAYSAVLPATTTMVMPSAPTNLSIDTVSPLPGEARLRWDADVNLSDGYRIEVSKDDGATYEQLIDITANSAGLSYSGNTVSASVGGLHADRTYRFRVRAYANLVDNTQVNRSFTDSAATGSFTPMGLDAMGAVTAQATNRTVSFDWTYPTQAQGTEIAIERKVGATSEFELVTTQGAGAGWGHTVTIDGLSPSTQYTFRVRAHRSSALFVGDDGTYSADTQLTVTTTGALPLAPLGPTSSTASSYAGVIDLGWKDPVDPNREGYDVQVATGGGNYSSVALRPDVKSGREIVGLQPGTTYSVRVRAVNSVGASEFVSLPDVTTRGLQPPTSVMLTPSAAGSNTNRELDVTWSYPTLTPSDATPSGFIVELQDSAAPSAGWQSIEAPNYGFGTGRSLHVTGLDAGTTYVARVRAVFNSAKVWRPDGAYEVSSAPSATSAPLTTTTILPAVPAQFGASLVDGAVKVAWTDAGPFEDDFQIEVSADGASFIPLSGEPLVAKAGNGAMSQQFSAATWPGTTQWVRIRSSNQVGPSDWTAPVSVNIPSTSVPSAVPPAPSTLDVAVISAGEMKLTWTPSTGADGYQIFMAQGFSADYLPVKTINGGATTQVVIDWLTPGKFYAFQIHAYNAAGLSGPSNTAGDQTWAFAAPSDLTAEALSPTQVLLQWKEANTDEGGFLVEQSTDGINFTPLSPRDSSGVVRPNSVPDMRAYLVQGLTPSAKYYFRVKSLGGSLRYSSVASNTAGATAVPLVVPPAPVIHEPEVLSDHEIRVTWDDVADSETRYEILLWRKNVDIDDVVSPGLTSKVKDFDGIQFHESDLNDYIVSGLDASTEYEIRVRASNVTGSSIVSDIVAAKTLPPTPTNPSAHPIAADANLISWEPVTGATGYLVQRSVNAVDWTDVGTTAGETSLTDSGLTAVYFYRVKSFTAEGESAYTQPFVSRLALPSLSLASVGTDDVTLHYTHPLPGALAGYRLSRKASSAPASSFLSVASLSAAASGDYVDPSVAEGESYTYQLSAISPIAAVESVSVAARVKLRAPIIDDVKITSGTSADIYWENQSARGVNLRITYTDGTHNGSIPVSASLGHYTIKGSFLPSTDYTFTVQLTDGPSDPSDPLTVTSPAFPHKPTSLSATTVSAERVSLDWSAVSENRDGFVVERSDNLGSTWTALGEPVVGAAFTDDNVGEGGDYRYRVRAFNDQGQSEPSDVLTVRVPLTMPSDVRVNASGAEGVDVSWTNNSRRALGVRVYFRTAGTSTWGSPVTISNAAKLGNAIAAGTFSPNTEYELKLEMWGNDGLVSDAVTATFTTPDFPLPPTGVQAPSAGTTYAQVRVTWMSGATNVNGFIVQRTNPALGGIWQDIGRTSATDLDLVDSSVAAGVTYQYRVRAFNGYGTSLPSSTITVETPIAPATGLTGGSTSGHEMTFHWRPSNTQGVTGYTGYLSTDPNDLVNAAHQVFADLSPTANTWTTEGPLLPNTTYYFTVVAKTASHVSAPSEAAAVTVADVPTAPATLTATPTSQYSVDLTWAASTNATGYIIYRHTTSEGWLEIARNAVGDETYTDASQLGDPAAVGIPLQPGYNFYYRVVAYNGAGESGYSPSARAVMPFTDPGSPTDLKVASPDDSHLVLTWSDHSVAGDDMHYVIERNHFGRTGWNEQAYVVIRDDVAPDPSGTVTFTDEGLDPAETYFYRVRGFRGAGSGGRVADLPTEYTNVAYGITQLAPGQTFTSSITPGAPGGAPVDMTGKKVSWRVSFNVENRNRYNLTGDPLAGTVVFKSGWVDATSPQDALKKVAVDDQSSISRTRPGEEAITDIPWMDPRFLKIDTFNGGGPGGRDVTPLPSGQSSAMLLAADDAADCGCDCPANPDDQPSSQAYDEYKTTFSGYVAAVKLSWYDADIHPCIEVGWEFSLSLDLPGDPGETNNEHNAYNDIDVDSLNDGGQPTKREDDGEDSGPGQFLAVNEGDGDGDGIPNIYDGFDAVNNKDDDLEDGEPVDDGPRNADQVDTAGEQDDLSVEGTNFIPVLVMLPPSAERPPEPAPGETPSGPPNDPLRVKFVYDASDPKDVDWTGSGTDDDPYVFTLPEGTYRLWRNRGLTRKLEIGESGYIPQGQPGYPARAGDNKYLRDPRSIADGGDYIPSDTYFDAFAIFGYGHSGTVYLEAVRPTDGDPDKITFSTDEDDSKSDTVNVTAERVDIDVDSDNTSADAPEQTDLEDLIEDGVGGRANGDVARPGKVVVVNDVDRDASGVVDMGEFNANAGKFVPVVIEVPAPINLSQAAIQISYSASDPSKNDFNGGAGYTPDVAGMFRLWTKDQDQDRDPASVLDGGDFVPVQRVVAASGSTPEHTESVFFQQADLGKIGLGTNDRTTTLYLEAVRPGIGSISISIDPDGIDTDLNSPPCTGDQNPAKFVGIADSVKITAVQGYAPETYDSTVRLADGALLFNEPDFTSNAAMPFGVNRVFTTAPELLAANPTGATVAEWPRLVQGTGTIIAAIGTEAVFFDVDADADTGFKARYGSFDVLEQQDDGYLLTRADGTRYLFNGFDDSNLAFQRGLVNTIMTPGGKSATFGAPDDEGRPTTVTLDDGGELEYHYLDNAWNEKNRQRFDDVTLKVPAAGGGSPTTAYEARYTYYTKDDEKNAPHGGTSGSVKTVTILHGDDEVEKKHYRWSGDRIYAIFDGRAYARMTADSHTPETSELGDITKYATYQFSIGGTAVSSMNVQGAGASSMQPVSPSTTPDLDASGQYTFSPGLQNPKGALGVNAWLYTTSTTSPGGPQGSVYMNYAGQVILDSEKDKGSNASDPADDKIYRTLREYDDENRVVLVAAPSAVTGEDPQNKFEGADVSDDSGLVTHYSYFPAGDGEEEAPEAGRLKEISLSLGRNGDPQAKQHTYTYEFQPLGNASIAFVDSDTTYRADNDDTVTTDYFYDDWSDAQPGKVTAISDMISAAENGPDDYLSTSTEFDAYGRPKVQTDGDGHRTVTEYGNDALGIVKSITQDEGGADASVTRFVDWDEIGRPVEVVDPNGNHTKIIRLETTVSSTVMTTPFGFSAPSTETIDDWTNGTVQTWTNVPAGPLTLVAQDMLDYGGRVLQSQRFAAANLSYTTEYRYDDGGRRNYAKDAVGTESETTFDALGRATEDKVNGTTVRRYIYDHGNSGDGNLTNVTDVPGVGAERSTDLVYDWRDRLISSANGVQLTYNQLDNLGEIVNASTYDDASADVGSPVDGVPARPSNADALVAYVATAYDVVGQAYRITQTDVQTGSLSLGVSLTTNIAHDLRGNVTKTIEPGGLVTETEYDGIGRVKKKSIGGAAAADKLEVTEYFYDAAGNTRLVKTTQSGTTGPRTTGTGYWYDAADRLTASADYGTAVPASPQAAVPNRSAALVTSYTYDAAGNVDLTTDPRGIQTKTESDFLGRTTKSTEAFGALNRETSYTYDGLDRTTSTTRVGQTTTYIYQGVSESGAFHSNDYLSQINFPGGGSETLKVNALGEVTRRVERDGTTHQYERDFIGRQIGDTVSNLPAGTDATVSKRSTYYDTLNRPFLFTSEGIVNGSWGNLNQVKRKYNGFGQVTDEWQEHTGSVNEATSPVVHYTYDTDGSANYSRLSEMHYPGGRTLYYDYGAGIDDEISRVSSVSDDVIGGIEDYSYLGLSTVVRRSQDESGLVETVGFDAYNRVNEIEWNIFAGGSPSSIEHRKYGYDENGNLLYSDDQNHDASDELYHASFDADASFYNGYDPLNRMTEFRRGTLSTSAGGNGQPDTVTSPTFQQSWTLDLSGNPTVFVNNGTRYENQYLNDVRQTAGTTNNASGAVTSETNAATSGTMYPLDVTQRNASYDAWKDATATYYKTKGNPDGTGVVEGSAAFTYDALGRAISEWGSYPENRGYDLYYDVAGNVIQERRGDLQAPGIYRENVFSPADGSVVMTENVGDGQPQNRFRMYAMKDGAGNVTAILTKQQLPGMPQAQYLVAERFEYTPTGSITFLNPNWTPSATPAYSTAGWKYFHEGMRFNYGDGLYHVGGQAYDPFMGRWLQPDDTRLFGGQNPYLAGQAFSTFGRGGDFVYSFAAQMAQLGQAVGIVPRIPGLNLPSPYVIPGSAYDGQMQNWRQDVGMEGMVPVYGSGKQAYYDFGYASSDWDRGDYLGSALDAVTGIANVVNVVGDLLLVKSVGSAALKGGIRIANRAAARAAAMELSRGGASRAAAAASWSKASLLEELRGATSQADKVVAAVERGEIRVNVLSDEMFEKAWNRYRTGTDPAPVAFRRLNQVYFRSTDRTIAGSLVHEGTHILDDVVGSVYSRRALAAAGRGGKEITLIRELRAHFFERQFELATGRTPTYATVKDMRRSIIRSYGLYGVRP